jgi:hypothetical protein
MNPKGRVNYNPLISINFFHKNIWNTNTTGKLCRGAVNIAGYLLETN